MQELKTGVIEETEFRLLLDGVLNCYGYDFREYAEEPLKRRIWDCARAEGAETISGYLEKVLHNPRCMERLLLALCARETTLFDEPAFWLAFRQGVVPLLRTYPSILLWTPACARAEDAYALAIILHEAGLSERCRIYATDLNEAVLAGARDAVFPVERIGLYTEQYLKAGGMSAFSDYYRVEQDKAVLFPFLRDHIVFAEHSLATDGSFNQFQAIICRSALQAFNGWLQERVCALFLQSLSRFGILGLGAREAPKLPPREGVFEVLSGEANFYRKVR